MNQAELYQAALDQVAIFPTELLKAILAGKVDLAAAAKEELDTRL